MKKAMAILLALTLGCSLALPASAESAKGPKLETGVIQADGIPAILWFLSQGEQVKFLFLSQFHNINSHLHFCQMLYRNLSGVPHSAPLKPLTFSLYICTITQIYGVGKGARHKLKI